MYFHRNELFSTPQSKQDVCRPSGANDAAKQPKQTCLADRPSVYVLAIIAPACRVFPSVTVFRNLTPRDTGFIHNCLQVSL